MVRKADPEMSIVRKAIDELIPYPNNPRTHSKAQVRQIAASIEQFGFTNPVLIGDDDTIIAGHGRVEAERLRGTTHVPTIQLRGMTPAQIKAYVIADNRLAERAGWDEGMLSIELQNILNLDPEFDLTLTGYDPPELDIILHGPGEETDAADEYEEPIPGGSAVSRPGDLWLLNDHRILCGSSLEELSFQRLMENRLAKAVATDPPYNVKIDGHVSGNGVIRHREFAMAAGEMSESEFVEFLNTTLSLLAKYSSSGSLHFVFMDWRHIEELLRAARQSQHQLLNLCVWVKDNGGLGSLYRSQHELVFVFRSGQGKHRNNVQLGKYGRNRTNVWQYPGINSLSKSGEEGNLLALHPTVKPVAMVADALLDCSAQRDIILDPFLGAGTTLMAAERTRRRCRGIEIDPLYVDTAIRRWQRYTGAKAILAPTKERFDDLAVLHA